MKKRTIQISIIVLAAISAAVITLTSGMSSKEFQSSIQGIANNFSPSSQQDFRLLWEDDFNGKRLDETHWSKIDRNFPAWACHMSKDDRLYRIKKGFLRLYCMRNTWLPNDTASVLTGGLTTKGKFSMGYGKLEVRARMTGAMGCWPAIWLVRHSVHGSSPYDYAELDVVERLNHDNKVFHTAHNHYVDTQKKQSRKEFAKSVEIDVSHWNTYAVEILPEQVIFSISGQNTFSYKKINIPGIIGQWPYGKTKCHINIDMQWGNPGFKVLRPQELPCYMDIDWVRVYNLNVSTP